VKWEAWNKRRGTNGEGWKEGNEIRRKELMKRNGRTGVEWMERSRMGGV
jgi:hypothetical protein